MSESRSAPAAKAAAARSREASGVFMAVFRLSQAAAMSARGRTPGPRPTPSSALAARPGVARGRGRPPYSASRWSPSRRVTCSRSRYSSSGMAYLRETPARSLNCGTVNRCAFVRGEQPRRAVDGGAVKDEVVAILTSRPRAAGSAAACARATVPLPISRAPHPSRAPPGRLPERSSMAPRPAPRPVSAPLCARPGARSLPRRRRPGRRPASHRAGTAARREARGCAVPASACRRAAGSAGGMRAAGPGSARAWRGTSRGPPATTRLAQRDEPFSLRRLLDFGRHQPGAGHQVGQPKPYFVSRTSSDTPSSTGLPKQRVRAARPRPRRGGSDARSMSSTTPPPMVTTGENMRMIKRSPGSSSSGSRSRKRA